MTPRIGKVRDVEVTRQILKPEISTKEWVPLTREVAQLYTYTEYKLRCHTKQGQVES